jgi:S1-C subfamily serine protease
MKKLIKTPFASAVAGGLVVAVIGLVAIGTGVVDTGGTTTTTTTVPATPASTALASDNPGSALSVNEIYTRDSPGVVFISARRQSQPAPFNPFGPSQGGTATGSGFIFDDGGHILTNAHVVEGSDDVNVRVGGEDGETFDAEVVGTDPSTDVAVLEVDSGGRELRQLELGSSAGVKVGDPVVAIGNPFGLDGTATAGIVSAVHREIDAPNGFSISDAIQTDAPINPGNSGGPLLDSAGRVIGINSQIESGGGTSGNVGIGFAVPIDTAQEVARQLLEHGEVQHAYMGITGADLTPEVADVLNLDADAGALVQDVVADSPADEAGIEAGDATVNVQGQRIAAGGDLITAVDGAPVTGMDDVIAAVDAKEPGDSLELTLQRGGDERTVTVELAQRPEQANP